MMVLAIGLTASAATAQNKNGGDFAPVGIYIGTETTEGKCDIVSEMCYGNSFVLNSYGEWETHNLTVSLNYSTNQFVPNNYIVTGGSWSLTVIRDNKDTGTLYGEIQGGSLTISRDLKSGEVTKRISINLNSTGGLGIFEGKESKDISGVYNATTDMVSKETRGNANFTF